MSKRKDAPETETAFCLQCEAEPCQCEDEPDDPSEIHTTAATNGDSANG